MNAPQQQDLPMELPPAAPALWREHTGTRFWAQYPEQREVALEMIREGTSLSEVARQLGPTFGKDGAGQQDGLRKHLHALIVSEKIDLSEIARYKAAAVRHEALDRAAEIIPTAGKKELGAVSMLFTQAHQVERNLGGMPTEIKVTTKLTLADLEAIKASRSPSPDSPIIDV